MTYVSFHTDMIRFLLCCAFVLVSVQAACDRSLADLSYRLSGSDLQWPCQSTKNIYVSSGRYVPKNVIITRAQMWNDQVIVAMPRYKPGVPFTLGKMSLTKSSKCIATLAPFPCWSMQEEGNCEALQSVVDLFLDPMVSANPITKICVYQQQAVINILIIIIFNIGYFMDS